MPQNIARSFDAGAAIAAFRIVRFGAAENAVIQSAAATDAHLGVVDQPGGSASGARTDIVISGPSRVEYGGAVTRGDLLTSDASGRAITATAAAGANIRIIGVAMVSGVLGNIGLVNVQPGSFQG